MPLLDGPLLLVGGGKMGHALLEGWLSHGLDRKQVAVVDPDAGRRGHFIERHIVAVADPAELPPGPPPEAVVLAVKPQMMAGALPHYRERLGADTFVLSIAAGKSIASFEEAFRPGIAVIRAMPNTPAAVRRGVTVLCANASATQAQRRKAEGLMAAVGEVHWIDDEELMHAVTAVSGSGPAYVFHLIEAMAAAGVEAGLSPELAMKLARGTVIGAGALAADDPTSAEQLRVNVTSPAGTTAAALEVLMGPEGLGKMMTKAVAQAHRRSRELA
ncbi:MAG: pyrroline-5-carboxylate reductase [Geminicoccaceae bacterium]